MIKLLSFGLVNLFSINFYGQPGALDSTFGKGGIVIKDFANDMDHAYTIAIQKDGKIIVGGSSVVLHPDAAFTLIRCNQDGSLDTSFGKEGIVITQIGYYDEYLTSIILQEDGKILAAGRVANNNSWHYAIARYNDNGSLDSSFGEGGKVVTNVYSENLGYKIVLQSDGKIIMAGSTHNGVTNDFAMIRYNSDGSQDSTFGLGGKLTTDFGNNNDFSQSIVLQKDNKIIQAGWTGMSDIWDYAIVRYNTDGSLDSSFGTGGKVVTDLVGQFDYCFNVAVQSDGKIILVGTTLSKSLNYVFGIVRYNNDGSLDSTFDSDGIVKTGFGGQSGATSVVIQGDGKLVVTGWIFQDSIALTRYKGDGSLDTGFGSDGKATTYIGSVWSTGQAVAIQNDGKIVVAGDTYDDISTQSDFVIARYLGCSPAPFVHNLTLKEGDSIIIGKKTYKTSGIYVDTFQAITGCDSIITTNLTFISGIKETGNEYGAVKIFPNPFSNSTTIEILDTRFTKADLTIYNLLGQEVYRQILSSKRETLSLNLQPGIYFYRISRGSEIIGNGKLVVR
jgi:uncharacterized delta-60 repeat protein